MYEKISIFVAMLTNFATDSGSGHELRDRFTRDLCAELNPPNKSRNIGFFEWKKNKENQKQKFYSRCVGSLPPRQIIIQTNNNP